MATNKPWLKITGGSAIAIASALGMYFEVTRYTAYKDIGGVPTICTGETKGVYLGMTATPAECAAMFQGSMSHALQNVDDHLKVLVPETRRAAMADLDYNIGDAAFNRSSVLRKINEGYTLQGCNDMLLYIYAGGKKSQGLLNRRQAEQALCLQGLNVP